MNRDLVRLRAAWDRRQLASKDRAGRHAKARALEMNLGVVKRAWLPLLFIGVAPSIAVPLAFLFTEGALRGLGLGRQR